MITLINKALRITIVPNILKIASAAIFILLVYYGIQAHSNDAALLKELRNTNIANLFVWSYWWPLIVVGAVFLGRIWCFACPVEMVTSLSSKIGLKLKRPAWMLSGWPITVFYIIILFVGIQVLKIHRDPAMMAVYLLSIAGVSVVTGLLFEKNTFCRYVCPVGHLLGLYSRLSIIGWRVKNKDICSTCKDKSCIRQDYLYNTATKSCGVDLYPGRLDDNTNCILCAGCLKACGTYNSTGVKERPNPGFSYIGFARDIFNHKALSYAEAAFLFVVSGFVISEILSEWNASNAVISMLPGIVKAAVGAKGALSTGLIDGFVVFLGYPFVIWTIPFIMLRLSGSGISAGEYLRNYAVAFIPIMAAAHLCKSILKMSSRIPYFQYAAADPTGMEMANDIVNKQIVLATMPEWTAYVVTALMVIFIAVGIHVSMRIIRNLNEAFIHAGKTARFAYSIPLLYGGIFAVTIVLWRFAG